MPGCTAENTEGMPISPVTSTPGSTPVRPSTGDRITPGQKKSGETLNESSISLDKTTSYEEYLASNENNTLNEKSVVSECSYGERDPPWEVPSDCSTYEGIKSCVANRTRARTGAIKQENLSQIMADCTDPTQESFEVIGNSMDESDWDQNCIGKIMSELDSSIDKAKKIFSERKMEECIKKGENAAKEK